MFSLQIWNGTFFQIPEKMDNQYSIFIPQLFKMNLCDFRDSVERRNIFSAIKKDCQCNKRGQLGRLFGRSSMSFISIGILNIRGEFNWEVISGKFAIIQEGAALRRRSFSTKFSLLPIRLPFLPK